MPALKIFGKRIGGPKEEDFKKRITSDDKMAPNFDVPKRASRVDFSEMTSKGPNMGKVNKITKKETSVETPTGDIGSVVREGNPEAIGPDMSQVIKDVAPIKPTRDFTATEMAQNLMSRGYNMKKGGMIKTKKMSSGGSTASKRADGCAVRGKTKGKMC
jgi:hypothetical protein